MFNADTSQPVSASSALVDVSSSASSTGTERLPFPARSNSTPAPPLTVNTTTSTASNTSTPVLTTPTMSIYHRPLPTRSSSTASLGPSSAGISSRAPTPSSRHSPLIPASSPVGLDSHGYPLEKYSYPAHQPQHHQPVVQVQQQPTICGLPLKYVSLVTLAVQNAALSIVMHYSRVSTPPSQAYSPASAVLLNEILKGSISFFVAFLHSPILSQPQYSLTRRNGKSISTHASSLPFNAYIRAFSHLCNEIFSPDCWKLSIPAILYVVQNSLQFVAISNLPVASFQVTYQMKILTTAAFSVVLLRRKLSSVKWASLFFLAIGVGIVQIQNATGTSSGHGHGGGSSNTVGSAHEFHDVHIMNPLKGFGAVTIACLTSGLAGVYFEMVLKGSKADLWVRNVQLSLFSLIPALLPILYNHNTASTINSAATAASQSHGFFYGLFRNFGWWAWATVAIQVFGGLITAVVIKYSDNILKGFATSLSIVFSFLASVALFDFRITPGFVIGATTVLGATWMYNQPAPANTLPPPYSNAGSVTSSPQASPVVKDKEPPFAIVLNDASPTSSANVSGRSSPCPSPSTHSGTPLTGTGGNNSLENSVLGGLGVGSFMRRKSSGFGERGLGLGIGLGNPVMGSPSRNSSTASLSALLWEGMERVPNVGSLSGLGTRSGNGSGHHSELGMAESGEIVHASPTLGNGDGRASEEFFASPFSSRPASRMPSRVPSRAPSPGPTERLSPTSGRFGRS